MGEKDIPVEAPIEERETDTFTHAPQRLVAGRNGGTLTPFNSETARAAVRAREEKRIRLYNIGAQRAVLDAGLIREFGDDAHIVERGMTLQTIASTADAGKAAVMAAGKLDVNQGLLVKGKDAEDFQPAVVRAVLVAELQARTMARVWQDIKQAQEDSQIHATIDGATVE